MRKHINRVLVVAPDLGLESGGCYRPGGLALFSRLVVRALASAVEIKQLTVFSLLDTPGAAKAYQDYLDSAAMRLDIQGFSGSKLRLTLSYLTQRRRHDLAMFTHIGVGQIAALTPFARTSLWIVGIESWRRLAFHERQIVRLAAPLLSISQYSSDRLLHFNPSLPSAWPVHLCVEPPSTNAELPAVPQYEASARDPAVLVVARMSASERYKGHDEIIDAWPRVIEMRPDAQLWIVGGGDDMGRLRQRAAALAEPARSQIEFLGRLDQPSLANRYARARVFAMPSRSEGFGLVFAEAMMSGLPCVASYDAAAEVVINGDTGFIVPQIPTNIANACARLLVDDDLANRFSLAGRKRYEQEFSYSCFRRRFLGSLGLSTSNVEQLTH